jgi:hypothetical protein
MRMGPKLLTILLIIVMLVGWFGVATIFSEIILSRIMKEVCIFMEIDPITI